MYRRSRDAYRGISMSRMIRKQIYLELAQDRLLKQRAEALGVSEAEFIRRCLGTAALQAIPLFLDPQAWADELAFLRQRCETVPSRTERRTWTREELYAERLERVLP
jgi:hypothetical protein